MSPSSPLRKIDDVRWEIPRTGAMRVPGRIYASDALIPQILKDRAVEQVQNVATLPGIVKASMAMPDVHWGYGFSIGGVAAFDMADGIISPGGIGYDISCGVRLLRTALPFDEIRGRVDGLMRLLFTAIPSGVGVSGDVKLSAKELKSVLKKGAAWAVGRGYGTEEDLQRIEGRGVMEGAEPDALSSRAIERGRAQLGTLGSGNHFLEIQEVTDIYDEPAARAMGLFKGQAVIMVHTGSRGLGYQVCDDYIKILSQASRKYGIELPDRQLACAPISSSEGKQYFAAMAAAANFARANRQIIGNKIEETLLKALTISPNALGLRLVYDVSHNIGMFEEHMVDGKKKKLCVHRKGATRAFPSGHPELPGQYRAVGQPVIIPGSMGTASYVLTGTEQAMEETFGSTCHGAGRVMSRTQAKRMVRGQEVKEQLRKNDIFVYTDSYSGLAEEMPGAYKDVDEVVDVCVRAGLSRKTARMVPKGVIKG